MCCSFETLPYKTPTPHIDFYAWNFTMTDAVLVEGTCPFSVNISVLVILVRESRNMQYVCLAGSAEGKDKFQFHPCFAVKWQTLSRTVAQNCKAQMKWACILHCKWSTNTWLLWSLQTAVSSSKWSKDGVRVKTQLAAAILALVAYCQIFSLTSL